MAEEEEFTPNRDSGGGGTGKIIGLVIGGGLFIGALSIGGMFMMLKMTGALDKGGNAAHVAAGPARPAIYHPLEPKFVVNINDNGRMRYLQVGMQIMTRDPKIVEHVTTHMPLLRNNLVLLLSSQQMDKLTSADGKEWIRQRALEEIQELLKAEIGVPGVEAVLLTDFVIQ